MSEPEDLLRAARPGQRWVVRSRLPDGSATDVLGWLERLTANSVQLSTLEGAVRVVDRADVLAARRAPAAPGGPPPERVSAEDLERLSLPGWLALHEPLGGWTLRAGGGFTGRANSCHAVGDPGMPVAEAARRIEEFAARNGIAPRAQVVQGSDPENELRGLGWQEAYVRTDVLAVRLADFLGTAERHPQVRVSEQLDVPWWDAYAESRADRIGGPGEVDPALLRLILAGNPPRAFATAVLDGRPVSIGRGHVREDWLGFAAVWTRPEHRRAGWATRVMVALGHWAARRGARYAYLQVASANTAAAAAYARLGFRRHHGYLYLAPPG